SNGSGRSIIVIPDLSRGEHDEQRKERAHGGQHARGECSRAHPQGGRKFHDYRVDHGGAEVSRTEKYDRHPSDREVMEPIVQYRSLVSVPQYPLPEEPGDARSGRSSRLGEPRIAYSSL